MGDVGDTDSPPEPLSETLLPSPESAEVKARDQASIWKQIWALRSVIVVIITPIVLLPIPILHDDQKTNCAYVILVMAVFWMTEVVPIEATSLIPFFLFPMMGLLTAKEAAGTFMSDTSMLFFGGLFVAVAIETWNLHRRIALLVMSFVGTEPKWLLAGLLFVTWFLSMWISNTAAAGMMVPIVQGMLQQLKTSGHREDTTSGLETDATSGAAVKNSNQDKSSPTEKVNVAVIKMDLYPKLENGDEIQQPPTAPITASTKQEDSQHRGMQKAMSLSICYAANIGGIACLTGTGPNLILKGMADKLFTDHNSTSPITFSSWLVYGLPLSALVLVVLWLWMVLFFLRFRGCCSCLKSSRTSEGQGRMKQVIREELKKLGPVSFAEMSIIVFFVILVVLWITRDLGGIGGWGSVFKTKFVTDSTPALFISFLLFVCPSKLPNIFCFRRSSDLTKPKLRPILTWKDAHEKMPWSIYLILGAGYTLAKASTESGLSEWLGNRLEVFGNLNPYVLLLVLCYISVFATEVTSNTATATLLMPILAQLAISLDVNPLFFMYPVALAVSFAFMLPVATPPNAIVFSYGHLRVIDMASCGFVMNLLCPPLLIFATATWGNAYFHFDTLPPGFAKTVFNTTTPAGV